MRSCLVIAVIFVFLRSFTATIIPSLTLPVSLIATFAVMYLLNYSLDNLSLMALTLCIGFVVDDTIVMLENIGRHMEMGKPAMRAAFDGAKEVEFTIIAMTVSLVAVFIPVLFMGGIVGRLLQEFAVTIGVAILVSCFVSISLTPMLCSRFLKTAHGKKHGRLYNLTERMFDGSLWAYDVSLQFAPQASRRDDGAVVAVRRRSGVSVRDRAEGISADRGSGPFQRQRRSDPGHRLRRNGPPPAGSGGDSRAGSRHRRFQQQHWRRRRKGRRGSSSNQGRISVDLKPRSERTRSVDQIMASLRPKLSQVPGVRVFMVNQPPINLGGMGGARSSYQFTLQDPDTEELYRAAPAFEEVMRNIDSIEDVNSDLRLNNPQVQISLNRDRIAALGLTVNQVETALFNAYGTRQVSQIYAASNQYQVILQVAPEFQQDPAALSMLYVRSTNGKLIPLNTVATVTTGVGPLSVSHTGQLPSVNLSFNLKPGHALGDAVNAIEEAAATTLPATVTTKFQGTAQAFQESLQGLGLVLDHGDRRDLHRARHSLRELHAAAGHSVGPSGGGLRRAAHAAALQDGTQSCTRSSASSCSSGS